MTSSQDCPYCKSKPITGDPPCPLLFCPYHSDTHRLALGVAPPADAVRALEEVRQRTAQAKPHPKMLELLADYGAAHYLLESDGSIVTYTISVITPPFTRMRYEAVAWDDQGQVTEYIWRQNETRYGCLLPVNALEIPGTMEPPHAP